MTQVSLGISFAFKLFFFFQRSHPGVLFWRGALNLQGRHLFRDAISTSCKVASMRSHLLWHECSHVGLLHIFGAHCGGLLLLLFFCFGINPRGEIGIQLDVSLWSQEREIINLLAIFADSSALAA